MFIKSKLIQWYSTMEGQRIFRFKSVIVGRNHRQDYIEKQHELSDETDLRLLPLAISFCDVIKQNIMLFRSNHEDPLAEVNEALQDNVLHGVTARRLPEVNSKRIIKMYQRHKEKEAVLLLEHTNVGVNTMKKKHVLARFVEILRIVEDNWIPTQPVLETPQYRNTEYQHKLREAAKRQFQESLAVVDGLHESINYTVLTETRHFMTRFENMNFYSSLP